MNQSDNENYIKKSIEDQNFTIVGENKKSYVPNTYIVTCNFCGEEIQNHREKHLCSKRKNEYFSELPSVTTQAGDKGTTTLGFSKDRIPKDSPIIELIGTIDELNAHIGVCSCQVDPQIVPQLRAISNILFDIGGNLSCGIPLKSEVTTFSIALEEWTSYLDTIIPKLQKFVLPGGHISAAQLNLARTVCRRTERLAVQIILKEKSDGPIICQLFNRLSDYLFILSRYQNFVNHVNEVVWPA